jgi:hypothetical protein
MFLSTVLCWNLGRFFSCLIFYTVGWTPWTGDQPVARPLATHRTTQTQNKRTQTSMPRAGFKPAIPAFERAKTVHALERAATVIGILMSVCHSFPHSLQCQVALLSNFSIIKTEPYQSLIDNLNAKDIMRSVVICTFQLILSILLNHGRRSDLVAQIKR